MRALEVKKTAFSSITSDTGAAKNSSRDRRLVNQQMPGRAANAGRSASGTEPTGAFSISTAASTTTAGRSQHASDVKKN